MQSIGRILMQWQTAKCALRSYSPHSGTYQSVRKSIKDYLLLHLTLPNKVIINSNTRTRVLALAEKLETYLDEDEVLRTINVLTLLGPHARAQKATTIDIFVNGSDELSSNFNILCATSGVGKNAGIDCRDVRAVYLVIGEACTG